MKTVFDLIANDPNISPALRACYAKQTETNFDRVERNRREGKLARENAEWRGCDSLNDGDDDDWS